MSILVETVSHAEAHSILSLEEGQFADLKGIAVSPAQLTKAISAFANSDGGELYIGVQEKNDGSRAWEGFADQETANGHLQIFDKLFPLGAGVDCEFLRSPVVSEGLVLHVQINKSVSIMKASNGLPYVRRGAQSLPVDSPEAMRRLEYSKGVTSFEDETTNVEPEALFESDVLVQFLKHVVPSASPDKWLRKQALIRQTKPTVAGVLMFSDEPQAQLPKRCGIKVYRYKTSKSEGFREALAFTPETVEGCLYDQIKSSVSCVTRHIESIQKMGSKGLEHISYPPEALQEIIANAVLHRDYSIADDVHIRIFENRIEVQSPGRLPAHVTVANILNERYARNGAIVRILNKFPDPPNRDVGEGLNTAFSTMQQLGLKVPVIQEKENSVLVVIKHESLASPEEAIMDYLERNETIKNKTAREITHIPADYQIKRIFGRMITAGMIEQVPGTIRNSTAYRKKMAAQ